MNKWILTLLCAVVPVSLLAGTAVEELNRNAAMSGYAQQADDLTPEQARQFAGGDFAGKNRRLMNDFNDPRAKKQIATSAVVTDGSGRAVQVNFRPNGVPAPGKPVEVDPGVSPVNAGQQQGNYANEKMHLRMPNKTSQQAGQPTIQQPVLNRVGQNSQAPAAAAAAAIANHAARQNGATNYSGQGRYGSYVPAAGGRNQSAAVQIATQETVQVSGAGSAQEAAAANQMAKAADIGGNVSTTVSQEGANKLKAMTPEQRQKYYTCLRMQARARRARSNGISMDIGACENMDLDKITTTQGEMSQEELEARADALAAKSLAAAKEEKKQVAKQKHKMDQKAKEKAAKKLLKTANKECSPYRYEDICDECCTSFKTSMGSLENGKCRCR